MRAFAGESQARNRYTFAANVCCTNKLQVLEAIFLYTAGQEKEHAEIFYNHLVKAGCENVTLTANYAEQREQALRRRPAGRQPGLLIRLPPCIL